MNFSWRRKSGGRGGVGKNKVLKRINSDMEVMIPRHFRCPISLDLMKDPVTLSTGITYDRENIEKWIEAGKITCPVTNEVLRSFDLIPNHSIRKMIQEWCVDNKSYGVERIPTPRIPITLYEVAEIRLKFEVATRNIDARKCQELLAKIKNLAKENERNKQCIVSNGNIGYALADSFESFSRISMDDHMNLLKEIMSMLTWAFPNDQEGVSKLKSATSLGCIEWFLKSDDLSSRQNAISLLKDLILADKGVVNGLMEIESIEETLFQIVKVQICPRATKTCLVIIHHMMLSKEKNGIITSRFVKMGLIPLILEILVDGDDKSIWEKALAILDSICNVKEGRERTRKNALSIPIILKKIMRVSDGATEFCVSILWNLCIGETDEGTLIEAAQLGAFEKLLIVLQVGCCERRKEATELLKLMNLYRGKVDCFDSSMGLKYVKRSN